MSERTGYPQGTPCWADVWTDDPEGGRAFYAALFGWEWEVSPDPAFGGYAIGLLRGKRVVGLSPKMDPNGPTAWVSYLAVDDADAFAAAVPGAGGTVVGPPMDIADQGGRWRVPDPAGRSSGPGSRHSTPAPSWSTSPAPWCGTSWSRRASTRRPSSTGPPSG